jgi:hypothetical protein
VVRTWPPSRREHEQELVLVLAAFGEGEGVEGPGLRQLTAVACVKPSPLPAVWFWPPSGREREWRGSGEERRRQTAVDEGARERSDLADRKGESTGGRAMGKMRGRERCEWGSGGATGPVYSVLRVWSQPSRVVKLDLSFAIGPG